MLLLAFASCQSNTEYSDLFVEIDSTVVNLENNRSTLSEMNEADAAKMLMEFDSLNKIAMALFNPKDTAQYWRNEIADLQFCSKSISRYINEEKHIVKELDFTINQLKSLKEDLQNGLVAKDKVEEYSSVELHLAAQILQKSSKRGGRALHCYTNFNSIIAKADSVYQIISTPWKT